MILLWSANARAGSTVTNCGNDTQFSSLLVGGGAVAFNCGTASINLDSTQIISANTTIDGGGQITLSGQNARQLFVVNPGASLTLRNIVLTNGFSSGNGGAIYNGANGGDGGVLILENSAVRDSLASLGGGAIVSTGPLTITNSRLEGNRALNGGALYPGFASAVTKIVNSVMRDNHATGTDTTNGWGGAILAFGGAPVTIEGSDIFSNSARLGGGIYNFPNSSVTLNGSKLHDNSALNGGGVYNDNGTATLTNVTLSGNSASSTGGGIYFNNSLNGGTVTLTNVTLSGNSAISGGGIYNILYGTATLTNVTLNGNSASSTGGGIDNEDATVILTNVTMSGNSAGVSGGGIYHAADLLGRILVLKNTIVANSPAGGNCFLYSGPGSVASITSNGFNLSDDTSCAQFLNLISDRNNLNPLLGPLTDNGGPTLTHLPQAGSPAIDRGSGCPAFDQRGAARPVGPACDIGAVEYGAHVGQSIQFGPISNKTLTDLPFVITATSSSDLPVDFSTNTPSVCTVTSGPLIASVSSATVVLSRTGTCTLVAQQPGNQIFDPALAVTQTFNVSGGKTFLPLILR